jgi:hypothetical protein
MLPPPACLTGVDLYPSSDRVHPPPWSSAPGILGANPVGSGEFAVGLIVCSPVATGLGTHGGVQGPSSGGSYNGGESRIETSEILSSCRHIGFDLDSLLGYFWERSRVSSSIPSQRAESFGWWRGKVAGDSRSFAQVVASSSPSPPPPPCLMTHKYRGCIVVLSINKSVKPNKEQKVLMSGFDQGITVNTSKQVFRGIW